MVSRAHRLLAAMLFVAAGAALSACSPLPLLQMQLSDVTGRTEPDASAELEEEIDTADEYDWVIVSFEVPEGEFDVDLMNALFETELAADQALLDAGVGQIDGNGAGLGGYDVFFYGDDADEMWRVLEPVFAEAPIPWTRVELSDGSDDASPEVLTQG
ncbi:hypothetical protein ACH0CG_00985 [Microbacterium sp. 179-I 1D1 NHS]|uniref:hypothetical protein n=1 Tax=Microbacterium sp. 179-I 1D1 NHS TaxID=3374298 RepID=UPI0038794E56